LGLSKSSADFQSRIFEFEPDPRFGFKDSPITREEIMSNVASELDVLEEEVILSRLGVYTIEGVRYWIWALGEAYRQEFVSVWLAEGENGFSVDPNTRLNVEQYLAWKHRCLFYD